ncbi:MAG TPA: YqgE/AlgH family protein [Burkholderiales bacterium]|nr:YqgE/AlgH family protein [Burkholderiales bacterium]
MKPAVTLANHFLIAMPALADANFARTVTFICDHSSEGTMGLVVNRPTDLKLRDILDQLGIGAGGAHAAGLPVYYGGPVQNNRGFVLHEPIGQWQATLAVTDTLGVSSSRDILEAIAHNQGPARYLITLGYAGWSPGQLERELSENAWLNGPADQAILFDLPPEQRWKAAAQHVGVDLSTFTGNAGHA